MTVRNARPFVVAAAVLAAVGLVVLLGSRDPYVVEAHMDNANGLRSGRAVKINGAKVGTVGDIRLGEGDDVVADLEIEDKYAPIGAGASVAIEATNLLGEKFVTLRPGNRAGRPQPSGVVVPASRVTAGVDLDQVLDVLDAPTRARLGLLINEAGRGLTGRRTDFSQLLDELPPTLESAHRLLDQVVADRRTVADMVTQSDRFMQRFITERDELGAVVDEVGQLLDTLASRRAELSQTLAEAPPALRQVQGFLGRLEGTARLLGPAAGALSASAPPLRETISELEPFRRAVEPTLDEAVDAGPALTELADGATPVIERAVPALRRLAELGVGLQPVTEMLDDGGIDDALGFIEGWARATQTRDGLGHVFRGHAQLSLDTIRRLFEPLGGTRRTAPRGPLRPAPGTAAPAPAAAPPSPAAPRDPVRVALPTILDTVRDVTGKAPLVGGKLPLLDQPLPQGTGRTGDDVQGLLDYLLAP